MFFKAHFGAVSASYSCEQDTESLVWEPRCVLGLRDILDDPAAVQSEWQETGSEEALRRFYDAVWVYGDPAVFDTAREYDFSLKVAAKLRYVGYLDQREQLRHSTGADADPMAFLDLPEGRLVACFVGGGQDGAFLAEAFADAELPLGTNEIGRASCRERV